MGMYKRKILMLIGSVAVAAATGCGSSSEATVSGIITLDGNPIPKGMISFIPATDGTQAYAMSDESGNFEVYTGRVEGLRTGEYKVTVVARKQPTVTKTADGGPAPPGEAITPRWYAYPDSSGLLFNVESGSNEINLQLTSQPPAGWQSRGR